MLKNYLMYALSPIYISIIYILLYRKPFIYNDKLKKRYIIWCCLVMFFTFAFHHYVVGNDGATYYRIWESISDLSFNTFIKTVNSIDLEKGYLLSNWILSRVFPHPQFIFIFSGLFYSITLGHFIYKNCDDPVIGFMFFNAWGLFNFFVTGIRQGIAICICIWAVEFVKKKKFIPFLLLVVLASQFHMTALAFVIVWLIPQLKMNFKSYSLTIFAAIVSLFFIDRILSLIDYLINDNFSNTSNVKDFSGGFAWLVLSLLIVVFCIVINEKVHTFNQNDTIFFYMLVIALVTFVLRYFVIGIAERMTHYFSISAIVLLPKIMHSFSNVKTRSILKIGFILLSVVSIFYKISYSNHLIPYYYFWQV